MPTRGRRGKVCPDMLGVEVPLKKESIGLGDRLWEAGGPEAWGEGWEHWGGPSDTGNLGKGGSSKERDR